MPDRRSLLAMPLLLAPRLAAAQEAFPSRAIAIYSGYAPGGLTDVTSRAVAERMSRELGVPGRAVRKRLLTYGAVGRGLCWA